jgi:hypothetical protein
MWYSYTQVKTGSSSADCVKRAAERRQPDVRDRSETCAPLMHRHEQRSKRGGLDVTTVRQAEASDRTLPAAGRRRSVIRISHSCSGSGEQHLCCYNSQLPNQLSTAQGSLSQRCSGSRPYWGQGKMQELEGERRGADRHGRLHS